MPCTSLLQDCLSTSHGRSNQDKQSVIIKSVDHFRIFNERDILLRFQDKTPFLRPLLDEIQQPATPPIFVLKYMQHDLLHISNSQRLTRMEVKHVTRRVLEAISVLHREGFVHTGNFVLGPIFGDTLLTCCSTEVKQSNVLVDHECSESRFKKVQLADFGSKVHVGTPHARDGDAIGTPIFRSPEAHLQMRWGTATDIWSFGAMVFFPFFPLGDFS